MSSNPEIVITFPGGKRVDADFFGRRIATDQPIHGGGTGSAPEPFALFAASIGTCAGIYVLGFLQARGLDTSGLVIRQSLDFDPATGVLRGVDLKVDLPPSVPAKYHEAIRRAADQCAVKKAIQAQPQFTISVQTSAQKNRGESVASAA
jgi:ribosomal protein S12 methylthiotransferase accessory factor